MKKYFSVISCIVIALNSFNAQSQTPYYMDNPVGFAAGVTGGGTPTSSNTVTVTTSSELSSALSGSKTVILISGKITTLRLTCTASNKSIIGLPGATLTNLNQTEDSSGILNLKSGSNVIIRNIIFIGPGAYDVDGWDLITNKGCTNLWVDHCEFQDGMDGNFDNTNSADNITVSWCKFTYLKSPKSGGSGGSADHRFTNLVGGSDSDTPDDGFYSITWLNCWWTTGCVDRMVRARNAKNDMLNCYWNSQDASKNIHLSPGDNGTYIYVANGVFECTGEILNFEKTGNNNVKFVNCSGGGSNTGSVSAPTYSWVSTSVSNVKSMVSNTSCGAGATLKVTADGVISSSCTSTDIAERNETENNNNFLINNELNISFSQMTSENAVIIIYGVNGQKVFSFIKRSAANENIRQNISRLVPGIYFVKIQDRNSMATGKFLKKL
ncbi:MAG TPA: pectate lyase [Fibrobacteres bacterium]|jgi:pectate lyase|nr:pectate lyase [Fibrobacterota bacterium]